MMKKKWLAICASILFLTGALLSCASQKKNTGQEQAKADGNPKRESLPGVKGGSYAVDWQLAEIPAPSLSSNLIEEPDIRKISILLPQSYHEKEEAYAVLYFLNGYGSSHESAAQSLKDAMMALELDKLIIVSVDAINRLNCSYYVNSPVTGSWQDFVTKDVVGYMDANYRTISNASGRGIAGHSIGGFGVMNIALNTEGIFDYVYAMSPAVFAPGGLADYGLQFEPMAELAANYQELSGQEASGRYLEKLGNMSWQPRFAFDYASAFTPDAEGRAPYILLPERTEDGEYLRDAVWEQYQNGLGGPPQQLAENRSRLLKLGGLVVEYGRQDESIWIRNGCKYMVEQLEKFEIPFDLRVYDGDHSSKVPMRFISDVLPYFADHLLKEPEQKAKETESPAELENPVKIVDSSLEFEKAGLKLVLPDHEIWCKDAVYSIIGGSVAQISFYDGITDTNATARAGKEENGDPSGIYLLFDPEKEEKWSAISPDEKNRIEIKIQVTAENQDVNGILASWNYDGASYTLWEEWSDADKMQVDSMAKLAVEIAKKNA